MSGRTPTGTVRDGLVAAGVAWHATKVYPNVNTVVSVRGVELAVCEGDDGTPRLLACHLTPRQVVDVCVGGSPKTAVRKAMSYGDYGHVECSECHAPVEPSHRFCHSCGARFERTEYRAYGKWRPETRGGVTK